MKGSMALLVDENPQELYLGSASTVAGAGSDLFGPCPWAAALVGSRKEKVVAHWLFEREIPYFLPLERSKTLGTRNRIYKPVFDGVIFFRAHDQEVPDGYFTSVTPAELEIRRHQFVYTVLKTGAQVRFKRELSVLAGESKDHRTLLPEKAMPGLPVRVIDGPMKNLEGEVESLTPGKTRVTVLFHLFNSMRSVEIDTNKLMEIPREF